MKKTTASLLAFIVVVLYSSGYGICEYFYFDDIENWKLLRDKLRAITYISFAGLYFLPKTKLSKAAMVSFFIFAGGNFTDRFIFGVINYSNSDYVTIAGAICAFVIALIYFNKHDTKTRHRRLGNIS